MRRTRFNEAIGARKSVPTTGQVLSSFCFCLPNGIKAFAGRKQILKALTKMTKQGPRRIKQHSRTGPTHHNPYLLTHLRLVTMYGTILANGFTVAIPAMLQTPTCIIGQLLIVCRQLLPVLTMATIKVYHQPDGLAITLYSIHFLINVEPEVAALSPFTCMTYTPSAKS